MLARPPVVEQRRSVRSGYAIKTDDRAELLALANMLRNIPRDSLSSIPDVIHHSHRVAGRIVAVADRLEMVEPVRATPARQRLMPRPAVGARAVAEGVFGKTKPGRRETRRTITSRKGGRIDVYERASRQMELGL